MEGRFYLSRRNVQLLDFKNKKFKKGKPPTRVSPQNSPLDCFFTLSCVL